MKKRIMVSLMMVSLVCALVGGATFAYFSDSAANSANTFTAGTLNMKIAGEDDKVTGTWVSPTNWAPGQEVSGTVELSNTGSIKAQHVYFGFTGLTHNSNGDATNLMDKIIVTEVKERFNGTAGTMSTGNQAAALATQVGNGQAPLTLAEMAGFMTNGYGFYTYDDINNDGVLDAGDRGDYALQFKFQFDPAAGNEYQGDTCGFTLMANATQNSPTEGLVGLHESLNQ